MMGRLDVTHKTCQSCGGAGRDRRKRKRPCPACSGTGQAPYCTKCGGLYGEQCVDTVMDQTYCSRPEPITANEMSNIHMVEKGEAKHPVVILNGSVRRWVGIGWIDEGPADKDAYGIYPTVV